MPASPFDSLFGTEAGLPSADHGELQVLIDPDVLGPEPHVVVAGALFPVIALEPGPPEGGGFGEDAGDDPSLLEDVLHEVLVN